MNRGNYYVSHAALCATAAVLSRRGYDVAFTVGNTPHIDLICSVPRGCAFKVQVKGISSRNALRIQYKFFKARTQTDLYLVIVLVPATEELPCEFFVLSHVEAQEAFDSMPKVRRNGLPYGPEDAGLNWGSFSRSKGHWRKLPQITESEKV